MYLPPSFRLDPSLRARLVAEHPLATLIRVVGAEPVTASAPLYLDGDALIGHLARANPFVDALDGASVLAVFHGPDAYVSPTWYGDPAAHVPTWNYVTAEARGVATVVAPDAVLDAMVAAHEPAWRPDAAVQATLSRAIVAFRLGALVWECKAKLSQNRDPDDRARVAARIDPAVARWMR